MRLSLTPRPLPGELKNAVKRVFRRTCEDLDIPLAGIAEAFGINPTVAERWAKEKVDHHIPVWALCDRKALPDQVFHALVACVRELRAQQGEGVRATAEAAAFAFVARAGEALAEIANAAADRRIDPAERPGVRRAIARVRAQCDAVERALDAEEAAEHTGSDR